MTEIDLLVTGDFLYPMSEGGPIVRDGEVAVRDGRILHAGPRKEPGHWQAARVAGGPGRAILPGFINCHRHAASLVFRLSPLHLFQRVRHDCEALRRYRLVRHTRDVARLQL